MECRLATVSLCFFRKSVNSGLSSRECYVAVTGTWTVVLVSVRKTWEVLPLAIRGSIVS